ncbi:MAG TPA: helix-turn-helix domain-containing protein [Thermoguttaceae bacterium]|nr:helix-turn-helix domain-containing protein [Thermoguttaceae bacterium]
MAPPPEELTPKGIDWERFSDKVRAKLEERKHKEGWTQETLAETAGVSQALVSNLITRRRGPVSRKSAEKLADALGLQIADFERSETAPYGPRFAFCGSTSCPSVCLATVEGKLYVAPRFLRLRNVTSDECPYCDSLIYRECPNCREPISEKRLHCPKCKEPYVPVPDDLEGLPRNEVVRECELRNRMNEQIRRHLGDEL